MATEANIPEPVCETKKEERGNMVDEANTSSLDKLPKEEKIQAEKSSKFLETLEGKLDVKNVEDTFEGENFLTSPSILEASGDISKHRESPTDENMAATETSELAKEEVVSFIKSEPTNITNSEGTRSDAADIEARQSSESIPGNIAQEEMFCDSNKITKAPVLIQSPTEVLEDTITNKSDKNLPCDPLVALPQEHMSSEEFGVSQKSDFVENLDTAVDNVNKDENKFLKIIKDVNSDDYEFQGNNNLEMSFIQEEDDTPIHKDDKPVATPEDLPLLENTVEREKETMEEIVTAQSNPTSIKQTEENSLIEVEASQRRDDEQQTKEHDEPLTEASRDDTNDGTSSVTHNMKTEEAELSKATEVTLLKEESQMEKPEEFLHGAGDDKKAFALAQDMEAIHPPKDSTLSANPQETIGDREEEKIIDAADMKEGTLENVLTVPNKETEDSVITVDASEMKQEELSGKECKETPPTETSTSCASDIKSAATPEVTFENEDLRTSELSAYAENASLDMKTSASIQEVEKTSSSEGYTPDPQGTMDDNIEDEKDDAVEMKEETLELENAASIVPNEETKVQTHVDGPQKTELLEKVQNTESTWLKEEELEDKPVESLHVAPETDDTKQLTMGEEAETTNSLESHSLVTNPLEILGDKTEESTIDFSDEKDEMLDVQKANSAQDTKENLLIQVDSSESEHLEKESGKPSLTEALTGCANIDESGGVDEFELEDKDIKKAELFSEKNIGSTPLNKEAEMEISPEDIDSSASEEMATTSFLKEQSLAANLQGIVSDETEGETIDAADSKKENIDAKDVSTLNSNEDTEENSAHVEALKMKCEKHLVEEKDNSTLALEDVNNGISRTMGEPILLDEDQRKANLLENDENTESTMVKREAQMDTVECLQAVPKDIQASKLGQDTDTTGSVEDQSLTSYSQGSLCDQTEGTRIVEGDMMEKTSNSEQSTTTVSNDTEGNPLIQAEISQMKDEDHLETQIEEPSLTEALTGITNDNRSIIKNEENFEIEDQRDTELLEKEKKTEGILLKHEEVGTPIEFMEVTTTKDDPGLDTKTTSPLEKSHTIDDEAEDQTNDVDNDTEQNPEDAIIISDQIDNAIPVCSTIDINSTQQLEEGRSIDNPNVNPPSRTLESILPENKSAREVLDDDIHLPNEKDIDKPEEDCMIESKDILQDKDAGSNIQEVNGLNDEASTTDIQSSTIKGDEIEVATSEEILPVKDIETCVQSSNVENQGEENSPESAENQSKEIKDDSKDTAGQTIEKQVMEDPETTITDNDIKKMTDNESHITADSEATADITLKNCEEKVELEDQTYTENTEKIQMEGETAHKYEGEKTITETSSQKMQESYQEPADNPTQIFNEEPVSKKNFPDLLVEEMKEGASWEEEKKILEPDTEVFEEIECADSNTGTRVRTEEENHLNDIQKITAVDIPAHEEKSTGSTLVKNPDTKNSSVQEEEAVRIEGDPNYKQEQSFITESSDEEAQRANAEFADASSIAPEASEVNSESICAGEAQNSNEKTDTEKVGEDQEEHTADHLPLGDREVEVQQNILAGTGQKETEQEHFTIASCDVSVLNGENEADPEESEENQVPYGERETQMQQNMEETTGQKEVNGEQLINATQEISEPKGVNSEEADPEESTDAQVPYGKTEAEMQQNRETETGQKEISEEELRDVPQEVSEPKEVNSEEAEPEESKEAQVLYGEREAEMQQNLEAGTDQKEIDKEQLINVSKDISEPNGVKREEADPEESTLAHVSYGETEAEMQQSQEAGTIKKEFGEEQLINIQEVSEPKGVKSDEADPHESKEAQVLYSETEAEMQRNLEAGTGQKEIGEEQLNNAFQEVSEPKRINSEEANPGKSNEAQVPRGEREAEMLQKLHAGTGQKEIGEEQFINASQDVSKPNGVNNEEADPEESKETQAPHAEKEAETQQKLNIGTGENKTGEEQLITAFQEISEPQGINNDEAAPGEKVHVPYGEREAEMQQNLEVGSGENKICEEQSISASAEVSETNGLNNKEADPEESKDVQVPYVEREAEMQQNVEAETGQNQIGEQQVGDASQKVSEPIEVNSKEEKINADNINEITDNFSFIPSPEFSSSNSFQRVEMPKQAENKEAQEQHEDLHIPSLIKGSFMETKNDVQLSVANAEDSEITKEMQKLDGASLVGEDENRKENTNSQESEVAEHVINKYIEHSQTEATIQDDLSATEKEQEEAKCRQENGKDKGENITLAEEANDNLQQSLEECSRVEDDSTIEKELSVTGDELCTRKTSGGGNAEEKNEKDKVKEEETGEGKVSDFGSEALIMREEGGKDDARLVSEAPDENISCKDAEETNFDVMKNETSLKDIIVDDTSVVGLETKSRDAAPEITEAVSILVEGQEVKRTRGNEIACETKSESLENTTDKGITSVPEKKEQQDPVSLSNEMCPGTSSKFGEVIGETKRKDDCGLNDIIDAELGEEETSNNEDNLNSYATKEEVDNISESKEILELEQIKIASESVAQVQICDTISSEEVAKTRKENAEAALTEISVDKFVSEEIFEPKEKIPEEKETRKTDMPNEKIEAEEEITEHPHLGSWKEEIVPESCQEYEANQEDRTENTEEITQIEKDTNENEEVPRHFEEDPASESIREKIASDVKIVEEPEEMSLENDLIDKALHPKKGEDVKEVTAMLDRKEIAEELDSVPLQIQSKDSAEKENVMSPAQRREEKAGEAGNWSRQTEDDNGMSCIDAEKHDSSAKIKEISDILQIEGAEDNSKDAESSTINNKFSDRGYPCGSTESHKSSIVEDVEQKLEAITVNTELQETKAETETCTVSEPTGVPCPKEETRAETDTGVVPEQTEVACKQEESTESLLSTVSKDFELKEEGSKGTKVNVDMQGTKVLTDLVVEPEATEVESKQVEKASDDCKGMAENSIPKEPTETSTQETKQENTAGTSERVEDQEAEDRFSKLLAVPQVLHVDYSDAGTAPNDGILDLQSARDSNEDAEELNKGSAAISNNDNLVKADSCQNQEAKVSSAGEEIGSIPQSPVSDSVKHTTEEQQPGNDSVSVAESKGTNSEEKKISVSCNSLTEESTCVATDMFSPSTILQDPTAEAGRGAKTQETQKHQDILTILPEVKYSEKETAQIARFDGTNATELEAAPIPATILPEADHTQNATHEGSGSNKSIPHPQHGYSEAKVEIQDASPPQKEQAKYGHDKTMSNEATKSSSETEKHSLSELLQTLSKKKPVAIADQLTGEKESAANKEETRAEKSDDRKHEEAKTDEEKDYEEESSEHKNSVMSSEGLIMVEMGDADMKVAHKKPHGILSGVGSKVKHSISKVKKAITGKSSHPKPPSPKQGEKH